MIKWLRKLPQIVKVGDDEEIYLLADRGADPHLATSKGQIRVIVKNPGREVKPLFVLRKPRITHDKK